LENKLITKAHQEIESALAGVKLNPKETGAQTMEASDGVFCPVCKFKNDAGVTFCVYCGHALESHHPEPAAERSREFGTRSLGSEPEHEIINPQDKMLIPQKGVAIYFNETNPIAVLQDEEFFLGRKLDEADEYERIIDLIPYDAFQLGVSRKHALVRRAPAGYEIIDLDSTNGTWVEEKRLPPNQPCPFPSGAQIRLGRMILTLLYGKSPVNS
jgi:hypothetical protein